MYRVAFRKDLNLLDIEWLAMFEPDRVGDYARKLRDQFDAEGFVPGYLLRMDMRCSGVQAQEAFHGHRSGLASLKDVTRHLYERVMVSDDFEAMHEPSFNIFCFRYRGSDDLNAAIREELIRSGEAWITSTVLKGQRVLRVTMINPRTERQHVDAMLDAVRRAAR